ncbi:MAG: type II toxin-antitoxin system VapC family toxin [Acidobacteriota bacterium]|nr:type II toxin-antitoxin system VapC family toxin [Acidobacteriota bacterium]
MIYVLDASAIIAWLRNEPGAAVVEAAVRDVNSQCHAHAINLCEVYYDAHRNAGEAHAEAVISDLAKAGVIERNDFDQAFWKDAGKLKAGGGVSLADCFAITLTNRVVGTLLTSDHHEMDKVAAAGICTITFIR